MRVLSGIQPSGQLHFGNYLGAIKPNVDLQREEKGGVFFLADLHALTTVHDAEKLRQGSMDAILAILASGFDPEESLLFRQSDVPEHAELMWILSTVSPMGLLERAVSYKEKVEKGVSASVGLFTYPVLMAADILLYQTEMVPVGKDQKQHLEMTRDIAVKFNATFGEVFTLPEPIIRDDVAVVPGTDGQKMSKSYGNTIPLFDEDAVIKKAIMGIVTDSKDMNDPKDPDTCVIYQIHKLLLSEAEAQALADEYRNGLPYGEAKKRLLVTYMDFLAPLREAHEHFTPKKAEEILQHGAKQAREIAGNTMDTVRKAVGLR